MQYNQVKSGQRINIKADEWNAVRSAVLDFSLSQTGKSGTAGIYRYAKIENGQPETVPAFGVLAVEDAYRSDDRDPQLKDDLSRQAAFGMSEGVVLRGNVPEGGEDEILAILQRAAQTAHTQPAVLMGHTMAWVFVNNTEHRYAKAIPDNVQMLESSESGPARILCPPAKEGLLLLPVLIGLTPGEPSAHAKELFPAVVYKTTEKNKPKTYIICPGGKNDKSIKTIHVIDVTERQFAIPKPDPNKKPSEISPEDKKPVLTVNFKTSTSMFGSLPLAMNNFDAAIAHNGFGGMLLVCTPGAVDEGTRYPVQRYDFAQEEWAKTDTTQSLAGCPAFLDGNNVIVAGGQNAYHVSNPIQQAAGTWGHTTTPYWSIDSGDGALSPRTPMRIIISGFSSNPENPTVNQQKRFLKQNFHGIVYRKTDGSKSVEYIAVGGTELLGYQSKTVVSYSMNSLGPVLDCENADVHAGGENIVFPDTPVPLGECCCVHIKKRKSGSMMIDCNLLVCIGGRFRAETDIPAWDGTGKLAKDENGKPLTLYKAGEFVPHEYAWYLNLDKKADGWKQDLWDKIPTPRWNAALSEPVETTEITYNEKSEEIKRRQVLRCFLIGGRTDNRTAEKIEVRNDKNEVTKTYYKIAVKKGLTGSVEALNLTDGVWETDFPSL